MSSNRSIHIPGEVLGALYRERGLSMMAIAQHFKCSQDTIARRLDELGICRRSLKKDIPKDELLRLYIEESWTIRELSNYYNCSHTTICNRLHDIGIRRDCPCCKKKVLSEETIVKAYKSGNSAAFIAEHSGMSRWTVLNILRRHKLKIRKGHKRKHLPLDEIRYLYQVLKKTTTEIGAMYNVKPCTVSARLKEDGLTVRGNRLSVALHDIIKVYEDNNRSITKTAKHFSCSYTTIRKKLVDAGIKKA